MLCFFEGGFYFIKFINIIYVGVVKGGLENVGDYVVDFYVYGI